MDRRGSPLNILKDVGGHESPRGGRLRDCTGVSGSSCDVGLGVWIATSNGVGVGASSLFVATAVSSCGVAAGLSWGVIVLSTTGCATNCGVAALPSSKSPSSSSFKGGSEFTVANSVVPSAVALWALRSFGNVPSDPEPSLLLVVGHWIIVRETIPHEPCDVSCDCPPAKAFAGGG